MAPTQHLIIGTAGHIDHGKTSLVRALTGVDLDRLPEERARGITISLGFTWLDLPDGRRAALVDVPGHERLVRTMVSGATGLDAVVFCVSAAEGVMPQTREHLDILGLLGIPRGIIALTMTDLVDDETLALARLDIEETVQGTFLEGAPIVETAAGENPSGLSDVVAELSALPPPQRALEVMFRLPIDRAFTQHGFGTVVTGTVRGGTIEDGARVTVLPGGHTTRVRGLQVHGQTATQAHPGQRAALNLAGIDADTLRRGEVVMPVHATSASSILDIAYRHLPSAPSLPDGARARLLIGTAEVTGVISIIDPKETHIEPNWEGFVQFRTDTPIVAFPMDRAVVRRESPVETIGGGSILDPWAPRARRRDRDRAHAELARLQHGEDDVRLERAGDAGLTRQEADARGISGGVELGDRVIHVDRCRRLERLLLESISEHHTAEPLSPGAPRRALHRPPIGHLSAAAYDALVQRLAAEGSISVDGSRIRLAGFSVQLTEPQRVRFDLLLAETQSQGLAGPKASALLAEDPELVALALDRGTLVRIGDHIIHRVPLADLKTRVGALLTANGLMSTSDFKDLTQLSRRHAIPLLEWLDAERVTVRDGESRRAWGV